MIIFWRSAHIVLYIFKLITSSRAFPVDGRSAGPHATKMVAVIDFRYKYKHYYCDKHYALHGKVFGPCLSSSRFTFLRVV